MYVENANRAVKAGYITPDNLEPNPKNLIIAAFFRTIGWSDILGSGVRNLFKYGKYYSGREPEFIEGDIFRIVMPLDENYSFDMVKSADKVLRNTDKISKSADKVLKTADKISKSADKVSKKMNKKYIEQQKKILDYITKKGKITTKEAESLLLVKERRARTILCEMVEAGVLKKQGAYKNTIYISAEINF